MSPKPILKRPSNEYEQPTRCPSRGLPNRNHGVHFPPSTSLTHTFSAYSAAAYDRSPIVVSPNTCALPERGCPGRTYTLEESAAQQSRRGISQARDFHPRALAFSISRSTKKPIDSAVPQLIPDLSSESDESDVSPVIPRAPTTFGIHGLAGPPSKYYKSDAHGPDANIYTPGIDDFNTLSFLPYPPSPPSYKYPYPESVDHLSPHFRRRRGERESKYESSTDPDRIPSSEGSDTQPCALAFSSLSISSLPTSSVTPKKRSVKKRLATTSHNFGNLDDGCLGGF